MLKNENYYCCQNYVRRRAQSFTTSDYCTESELVLFLTLNIAFDRVLLSIFANYLPK